MVSSSEVSMQEALMRPVVRFSALSESIFRALGPAPSAQKTSNSPPLSELVQCDSELAAALHLARIHQGKQREIDKLMLEILVLDAQLRDVIVALSQGKEALENMITEGDTVLERANLAAKGWFGS